MSAGNVETPASRVDRRGRNHVAFGIWDPGEPVRYVAYR